MKAGKTDFSKVDRLMDLTMKQGLTNLGDTILKRAIILAPKDSGDLRQSGVSKLHATRDMIRVIFGGGRANVQYARRRHWENNLHPSTRRYLTNAMKSISTPAKFFKRFF